MLNLEKEIEKYLRYCEIQKHLSAHTVKAYKIDLEQFLNCKANMSIAKEDIVDYIENIHKRFKPKTIRRKIASLKALIHYLYYYEIISSNPFDKIDTRFSEPMLLPRIIPNHIINSLISIAYKNIDNAHNEAVKAKRIRDTAVVEMLFATGARVSEICNLKSDDVDLKSQTVRILGKGSRERIIEIENKDVLVILRKYEYIFKEDIQREGYFFLNNRKSKILDQSIRIILKKLANQIECKISVTPHMFRHSVATMLLEEDVDIRYIQRILGHSSIVTTQRYTHVASSKQKEILRNKHPRNKIYVN